MNNYAAADAPRRREEILKTIRKIPVRSQEELQERLAAVGIHVTQPTLSRDIRELRLVKTADGYAPGGAASQSHSEPAFSSRLERVLSEFVMSVEAAGTLVVVRTPPAAAQPVARAIDEASLPGILGTIGGDDTIFLAVRNNSAASALVRRLREIAQLERSSRRTRA